MMKDGVRQEETPVNDAVRETLTNCIIHQDVNAQGHIIVERTDESLAFMNPGMMLVSQQRYFEGGRSICRSPTLQKMFMLPGRAEKAGSGVDKIVSGWQYLGWPHCRSLYTGDYWRNYPHNVHPPCQLLSPLEYTPLSPQEVM